MRLTDFILREMEAILAGWDAFAATRGPAGARLEPTALRDHAEDILRAIVADLGAEQTREQQHQKSLGNVPLPDGAPQTAAQTHAVLRARSGFDINHLVSEYRALRASVLQLWFDACGDTLPHAEDVVRFNEAVDQAIAESVSHFATTVEGSRNLLLGMLGHDMRSPLQTIVATSQFLATLNAGEPISQASTRLISSGARIQALLDDLVDFNRGQLGLGIGVRPAATDLRRQFEDEIGNLASAHPARRISLVVEGDATGEWDAMRLRQLLGNLVVNALRHGARDGEVEVRMTAEAGEVRLQVTNAGGALDPDWAAQMFDPLRTRPPEDSHDRTGLGLGLYIAREVARAHGGEIEAASGDGQTVFTVVLPRDGGRASRA